MGKVLSIDLALKTVRNFGICLLERNQAQVGACSYLRPEQLGLADPPVAIAAADAIYELCVKEGIRLVILDGPQGWKDPASGLAHSRLCERIVNAPAKTGTVGQVKPASYLRFVEFSIAIFARLVKRGAALAESPVIQLPREKLLVVESLPLSAWRKLKIPALPAKAKSTMSDCENRFEELKRRVGPNLAMPSSHDELQALVAGLGGIAVLAQDHDGYVAEGAPPFEHKGVWVEGFIVNPKA